MPAAWSCVSKHCVHSAAHGSVSKLSGSCVSSHGLYTLLQGARSEGLGWFPVRVGARLYLHGTQSETAEAERAGSRELARRQA